MCIRDRRELARLQEARSLGGPAEVRATYEAILALQPGDLGALMVLERMALESGDRAMLAQVDTWLAATSEDPCLLYTSPSPRDRTRSRMPSSA